MPRKKIVQEFRPIKISYRVPKIREAAYRYLAVQPLWLNYADATEEEIQSNVTFVESPAGKLEQRNGRIYDINLNEPWEKREQILKEHQINYIAPIRIRAIDDIMVVANTALLCGAFHILIFDTRKGYMSGVSVLPIARKSTAIAVDFKPGTLDNCSRERRPIVVCQRGDDDYDYPLIGPCVGPKADGSDWLNWAGRVVEIHILSLIDGYRRPVPEEYGVVTRFFSFKESVTASCNL